MGLVLGHMTASVIVGSVVDQPILVGAAGLVVILAILLVFVMVLRSGGRREVGIGLDGRQGPLGQPKAPPSQPRPFGANMYDAQGYGPRTRQPSADYGAPSQQPADASGWNANYQNPQVPWGQPSSDSQAPAVPPWGADQQPAPWQDPSNWAPAQSPAMPVAQWGQQAESGGWSNAPSSQGYGMPAQPVPAQGFQGGGWTGAAGANGASVSDDRAAFAFGGADATRSARPASSPGGGFGGQGRGPVGGMERAVLVVRKGKDVGHVFEVSTDRTTIGRSRDSDVFLEDLAVSRTHTTITRDNQGRYILRDEESANGTLVNGEQVKGAIILKFGDEVQVGQTVMTFSRR